MTRIDRLTTRPLPLNNLKTKWERTARRAGSLLAVAACIAGAPAAWSHGDVTPQAVDTTSLPKLGTDWRAENPFRANADAIKVGTSAYNQNCARCHGIEAISGG